MRKPGRSGRQHRFEALPIARIRACAAWSRSDCFCSRAGVRRAIAMASQEWSADTNARRTLCHERDRDRAGLAGRSLVAMGIVRSVAV